MNEFSQLLASYNCTKEERDRAATKVILKNQHHFDNNNYKYFINNYIIQFNIKIVIVKIVEDKSPLNEHNKSNNQFNNFGFDISVE